MLFLSQWKYGSVWSASYLLAQSEYESIKGEDYTCYALYATLSGSLERPENSIELSGAGGGADNQLSYPRLYL